MSDHDRCPACAERFDRLGSHWARSDCDRPAFTTEQWQTLVGLLMGDGDIHGRTDANPHFRVRITTRRYLDHLREWFGPLGTDVFLERTAAYQADQAERTDYAPFDTVNRDEYSDLFGFRTRSHPALHELAAWYDTGEKRFPDTLELTPTVAKAWYVCGGWLARAPGGRERAMIKTTNERDRGEYLRSLFTAVGFDPTFSRDPIQFWTQETVALPDWMGDPPPGFGYKWGSTAG